jgi:D-serine deaminase-like pyridoxal phosphate-dependent protein
MNYQELDTPALCIDRPIMMANLKRMQNYANSMKVHLRPHTKTHQLPYAAKLQRELGAKGITVAKASAAEVMAAEGFDDIFIANEIVGEEKLRIISGLGKSISISFGVDSVPQIRMVERVFSNASKPANVLVEIEVGEERSGVVTSEDFAAVIRAIKTSPHLHFRGVFSHEGHCYSAANLDECRRLFVESQRRTLGFAAQAAAMGCPVETVSIGSTPSLMPGWSPEPGVTEIRPGTYIFMDAAQAHAQGSFQNCAATVLATVMSLPTADRIVIDAGCTALTAQQRSKGICSCPGFGLVKGHEDISITKVNQEHGVMYDKAFHDALKIGDKVEIYPVHICPVVNLFDKAYLVENGEVLEEIPILCRGKIR